MLKKIAFYFIVLLATLLMIATILSIPYDTPYWYLKVLDFPRLQIAIALIILLVLSAIFIKKYTKGKIFYLFGLVACIGVQVYYIYHYSSLCPTSVPTAKQSDAESKTTFSVILLNVLMKNTEYDKVVDLINSTKPDFALLMETNQDWADHVEVLKQDYPYTVERIYENTYGMILFSKYPLSNTEILELSNPEVPSIHTDVKIGDRSFRFHGMHPVPPVPSEHPDNKGERENELKIAGEIIANNPGVHLVAGDLNDVSWSKDLRLFNQDGLLNNVSYGRGFINTYDANSWLLRWPLDHYYVTKEFSVLNIKTLESVGSDHFPVYAEFVLN